MLTSLRAVWLPVRPEKLFEVLPVLQQLPRLLHVTIPVSALCGKCYAREQAGIVSPAVKCDGRIQGLADNNGCKHFPGCAGLHCCTANSICQSTGGSRKRGNSKGASSQGIRVCGDICGTDVWGEYDNA